MKVLRPGRKPADWSREIGCLHCLAFLEVNADDVFEVSRANAGRLAAVECPDCHNIVLIARIGSSELTGLPNPPPYEVWKAAQRARDKQSPKESELLDRAFNPSDEWRERTNGGRSGGL